MGRKSLRKERAVCHCCMAEPMEIFPEVGHNKLFFVLARKLLDFIAILLDLCRREVRA